jgi:polysaccharide export outer membrane protein
MEKIIRLVTLVGVMGGLASCGGKPVENNPSARLDPAAFLPKTQPAPTFSNDLLRAGDTMNIRLSGVPGPEAGVYEEKINDSGEISMPLVGKFKAAGLSTGELKDKIETAYRRYYTTPNITVLPEPRYVNMDGDIRAPGRVVYTNDMTVLTAITSCGGFTDYADKHNIKIVRNGKIIKFDAKAAQEKPELDIPLQPGDQVKVERSIW